MATCSMLHYAWDECLNYIIIQMRVEFSIRRVPQQLNSIFMDEDLHFHTCSPSSRSRRILFNLNLPQLQFTTLKLLPLSRMWLSCTHNAMGWPAMTGNKSIKMLLSYFLRCRCTSKTHSSSLNSCSFAREKSINSIFFSLLSSSFLCVLKPIFRREREDLPNETAESEREKITENGSEFLKSN